MIIQEYSKVYDENNQTIGFHGKAAMDNNEELEIVYLYRKHPGTGINGYILGNELFHVMHLSEDSWQLLPSCQKDNQKLTDYNGETICYFTLHDECQCPV